MPPRPFVNDRLWRCLCPGFPPAATPASITRVTRNIRRPNALTTAPSSQRATHPSRAYSASAAPSPQTDAFPSHTSADSDPFAALGSRSTPFVPSFPQPSSKPPLSQIPTHDLYEHVRTAGAKGYFDDVLTLCRVLIRDRGEALNKDMYTAMLHSCVSPINGSTGKLRKILEEMGFWTEDDAFSVIETKFELDARACECILEVLAVHPDYLLRAEILEYMKFRWFPLSERAQNFVVAGMLRERHFEHALELLDDMVKKNVRVESWLFDKAMWMLLEFGEVDEAFYVLGLKEEVQRSKGNATGSVQVSEGLWTALLDAAAKHQTVYHSVSSHAILETNNHSTAPLAWFG